MVRPGVVSVVLVNYRGAADTITCVRAFEDVDWPAERLEIIVVDNDSGDGSVAELRAALPGVLLVESGSNSGFAGGCNLGVEHATGEYVAFLNNDARPDRGWVAAAVEALEADPHDRLGRLEGPRLGRHADRLRRRLADLVRDGLQARGREARPGRLGHREGRPVRHRRRDVRPRSALPRGRRVRRALLHVLRGRRPRVAAQPPGPSRALRPRIGRVPPSSRDDEEVRQLPRELPAGTQRAAVHVQELRRRVPREGAPGGDGARRPSLGRADGSRRDGARPAALTGRRRRRHRRDPEDGPHRALRHRLLRRAAAQPAREPHRAPGPPSAQRPRSLPAVPRDDRACLRDAVLPRGARGAAPGLRHRRALHRASPHPHRDR